MKKYILLLLFVTQFSGAKTAEDTIQNSFKRYERFLFEDDCDACGCSASGGGMGFNSILNQNFVGIRYMNQSYSSRDGLFNNSPWIDENFNTVQVWARIPITEKIQVSALVPYHFHNRKLSTGKQNIDGLGDITVLGFYTIYQTKKDSAVFTNQLQLGGGLKAPTGKYDAENKGSVNPSFQVGTGSWDYILAVEHTIKRKNLGLNSMLNYTFKTENQDHYQFGNQLSYGTAVFYEFEKESFKIVPQAGIAGETYATNKIYGEDIRDTKGDILFGKVGIEAGKDRFSVGVNAMLPISQNLTGGRVEANYRWSVNLNYSL